MAGVDPNAFRAAAGSFGSGVTVVTAKRDGKVHGMTVSAFASVSLDPTQILVSLRTGSRVTAMINASGCFAVSILGEAQKDIAAHFATSGLELQDESFPQFPSVTAVTGVPIFQGSLAHFDCTVAHAFECGDHVIFVGDVVDAGSSDGEPLMYYKGAFRGIRDWNGG